jgi:hypothetical protein
MTALRALSSSAYFSASATMFSMSFLFKPEDEATVMDWSLLVALSLAETLTIPSIEANKGIALKQSDDRGY